MKRKIIKQGHNTLTITIPNKWAQKHSIKAGDELDVAEVDRGLMVSTEKSLNLSSITVDVAGLTPSLIWRYILSAYRAGYDEIRVIGIGNGRHNIDSSFSYKANMDYISKKKMTMTSPTDIIIFSTSSTMRSSPEIKMSPVETITACVNRLINVEIIEQKENYCVIKELGETTYKEFDNALRRVFLLLKFEADYVMNALKGNKDEIKYIHVTDTNLDRFEDFCLRVLNKKGYIEGRKTPNVHGIVFLLELVGDELKKIGLHLQEYKKASSKPMIDLFTIQTEQISRFTELFYKFDKEKLLQIYEEDMKGTLFVEKHYKKLSDEDKELLHHFKKVGILLLNLTELRIDMEF